MNVVNRRLLSYILVVIAMSGLGILCHRENWHSNAAFHLNISVISAIISLFSGIFSLMRYYAKKVCPYLWIGLTFIGTGIFEIVYAYLFSFFSNMHLPSALPDFMMWGWWLSRMYSSVLLIAAFITCKTTSTVGSERVAYVFSSILLCLCLSLLLFAPLPSILFAGGLPRPLELIPAALISITLVGFFRQYVWKQTAFAYWLVMSLLVYIAVQLLFALFSRQVFDGAFLLSNVFKAVSHLCITIGLIAEIYELYKAAEDRLQRLTGLRLMVDQIRDYALFMMDPNGNILTWNKGAQAIKQYTPAEIVGQNFSRFYPEEATTAGRPQIELELAKEHGHFEEEGWRIKKDKTKFWANVIITPIYSAEHELLGFSKITRDLTERKKAEEHLKTQNAMLMQSNEQLEQYAYIATHDLKEPLRTIATFTQLLTKECQTSPDSAKFADYILKAVDRTRKMIDGLRTYTKVKSELPRLERTDLNICLQNAKDLLDTSIVESHAIINSVRLPVVNGVEVQLTYLFMHMIDNAIKYAKPGIVPVVDITFTEDEGYYVIAVKDNGVGIPEEYKDKVFAIFQKLHRKTENEGIGIGLSICKKVVSLHGGKIWYTSGSGGTIFYFTLPMPGEEKRQTDS